MSRMFGARRIIHGLLVLTGMLLIGMLPVTAWVEALPGVQDTSAILPHPAHIHRGICATGGETLALLTDAVVPANSAGGAPTVDGTGPIPVSESTTVIPIALADLLAEPASIEVHESALEFAHVIACGDLGGTPSGMELLVGLAPVEPHGAPGIAWLRSDGQSTVVTMFLVEGLVPGAAPTEPATVNTAAETVTVTLGGPTGEFTISASRTTFQVGVPYHFVVTNMGVLPHEFMILPTGLAGRESSDKEEIHHVALALIDEEDLPAGGAGAIDVTFTAAAPAGTIEIACELAGHYEAGMHLPIEVVD